jgi:hypothetical protein
MGNGEYRKQTEKKMYEAFLAIDQYRRTISPDAPRR